MRQLDLFENDGQCAICGDPLPMDRVLDGSDVCEECEADMDKLDKDDIDSDKQ